MPTKLKAIVTGGGAGIGRALVQALLEDGAQVLAVDRDQAALDALMHSVPQVGARLQCLALDVTAEQAPTQILQTALNAFGSVNVLINNAGIGRTTYTRDLLSKPPRTWEISADIWQKFFAVNAMAAIRLSGVVVPHLLTQSWGRIINVTTSLDSMLRAGSGPYGPSKAAFEAFCAELGDELVGTGITVNVLVPGGPTDTAMIPPESGVARHALLPPTVMVPPLRWLLSSAADHVNLRRFRANLWDPTQPTADAAAAAGAPIAWAGIAAGQMRAV